MKRLLYYIDNRIHIIHQIKHSSELIDSYDNDEKGLKQLQEYLKKSVKIPLQILLDISNENFFHESIPHVPAKDRKFIVKRLADRLLHQSHDFYYYQIQGREKQGRRNDKILLSGLTNPDFLQNSLKLLLQYHIPVFAIWSLPLLSLHLKKLLQLKQDYLLIVSRQNDNNLRLTFINKDQFSISRIVTLHSDNSIELIENEIKQTIKYLTNQRYIGFNDTISACIIVKEKNLDRFKAKLKNSQAIKYIFYSHTEIEQLLKIKNTNLSYNMAIYTELCFQQKPYHDHYSTKIEKQSYFHAIFKQLLLAGSFIFFISSILFSQTYLFQGWQAKQKSKHLQYVAEQINQQYQEKFLTREDQLKHAVFMKSSVHLTDAIKQYQKINPLPFYLMLSHAYAQSGLQILRLDKIDWHFNKTEKNQNDDQTISDQGNANANANKNQTNQSDADNLPNTRALVTAKLPLFDNRFRSALTQLRLFTAAIEQQKEVAKVVVTKYPVDVRPNQSVDGKRDMIEPIDNDNLVSFELEIHLATQKSMQKVMQKAMQKVKAQEMSAMVMVKDDKP